MILLMIFSCEKDNRNKDSDWVIFNHKNKIPEEIKDFFQATENSPFTTADPDEEFNSTDNETNSNISFRQLKLLEKKNKIWRLVFIQGGIGASYQYYQFKIQGDTISEIEKAYSFANIETNDSLEYYIKKGAVRFEKIEVRYK